MVPRLRESRGPSSADRPFQGRGDDPRAGGARRHGVRDRFGLGRGQRRRGGEGQEPRDAGDRRRVRRDEPDRAGAALGHRQGRGRRRVRGDELRRLRRLHRGGAGAGDAADADAGSPAPADQRADRPDRPGDRAPHPAVAARHPGRARRAGRAVGAGDGEPAAGAADALADRALPDRGGGDREGRGRAGLHVPAEHRGLPEPLVRQVRADRPGDLEPLRRRRGAGVARALRPLGAERRAPAPPGGAGDHARPVPPQHVPRDQGDVRLRPAVPGAGEARAPGRGRRAPSADRAGVPLPGADPLGVAGGPAPLHGGVGAGDGGSRRPTIR